MVRWGKKLHNYAVGIDTGGTFTDGVIFDLDNGIVLTKTKVITERNNLSHAIDNCVGNLIDQISKKDEGFKEILKNIKMVSLSTTLATNAIVEGQGADVGLIVIGIETNREYPTKYYEEISGKIDIRGRVKEELDIEGAKKAIQDLKGNVEAFAVSGYMSIRNPMHELEVAKLIKTLTGYPVVCGHELSNELGIYERTVTAVLNARLISLITDLIEAVKTNIRNRGIIAPLMVVKGDGSLISEQVAMERPVETILSGPAASVIGGKVLTSIENGMIVDMGGTTTDIALLKNGKPKINEQGASVGGWLTRVKASDISTIGLGGDSHICVSKNQILTVGPQKVYPLSWINQIHPHILDELNVIHAENYFPISSQPTTVLSLVRKPKKIELTELELKILESIKNEPHTIYYIAKKLGKDPNLLPWERLVQIGSIHRAGLTPTDILHYTGKFNVWNVEAANMGIKIMARRMALREKDFVEKVLDLVYYKIFRLIVETGIKNTLGIVFSDDSAEEKLLYRMFNRKKFKKEIVNFSAKLTVPVIALGAPVQAYFPESVNRLNTRLLIPENADVANAIGTVNGNVEERVQILIKPTEGGAYYVYTPEGRKIFMKLEECYEYGEEYGREYAYNKAVESGASDIKIIVERNEKYGTLAGNILDENNKIFIESIIEVTAQGKPWR